MNTQKKPTLKDIDRANFKTPKFSDEVNTLCRSLNRMCPGEHKGIILVSARVVVPNTTLGKVARLLGIEVESRLVIDPDTREAHTEHFLNILCGAAGESEVEIYCVIPQD